jgi:hypothetical protein
MNVMQKKPPSVQNPQNYPCEQIESILARNIYLAPCYAPDGSDKSRSCIGYLVPTSSGISKSDLGVYDHNGQRHTMARR